MSDRRPDFTAAVVDDDPKMLESLGDLLEAAGHVVCLFGTAAELLDSDCLGQINCLLSDIDLPGIDGFELLRRVQAIRPELPVILITGHPEFGKRKPPPGSGHYRMFRKPFDGQELIAAVHDAMHRSKRIRS